MGYITDDLDILGRLTTSKGVNIASANQITLGTDGIYFGITGTATINLINSLKWDNSEVVLIFQGGGIISHNATPSGNFKPIILSKGSDYTTSANDILILRYDLAASVWYETNNLTKVSGGLNNVVDDTTPQLGGMLDVNGQSIGDGTDEILKFSEAVTPVNEFTIKNAATTTPPELQATGDDANIDIKLLPKGTGVLTVTGTTTYETNVTDDDDIPNKKYVDDNSINNVVEDLTPQAGGNFDMNSKRLLLSRGVSVASANDLTLGGDGNSFIITGTTAINRILITNWTDGSKISLKFDAALQLTHNSAPSASLEPLFLAKAANYTTSANEVIELEYNSTDGYWYETNNLTKPSSSLTVGGASGDLQFNDGASDITGDSNLNWDNTTKELDLGAAPGSGARLRIKTKSTEDGIRIYDEADVLLFEVDNDSVVTIAETSSDPTQITNKGLIRMDSADSTLKIKRDDASEYWLDVDTIARLRDVDVTGANQGDVLVKGATNWEDQASEEFTDLLRYQIVGVTADQDLGVDLLAGYKLDSIILKETAGNAVTGGIDIGSTSGGNDIVSAETVGASSFNDATIAKYIFSDTTDTNLWISAVTAWNSASVNIYILVKKVI